MAQRWLYKPDELDMRILAKLQEECNLSIRQLGKCLGIPTSTVQRRINNLQDKGIIKGCHAVINKEYLGYSTLFSLINVTTGFIKDEGGYLERFAEKEIRERYKVEPNFHFIVDAQTEIKANPWEFVLDVFASLTPKAYGEDIVGVQVVYALHGRIDILAKIVGTDQKILGKYIEDKVSIIPGVIGVESHTVFDEKKDEIRLPFIIDLVEEE